MDSNTLTRLQQDINKLMSTYNLTLNELIDIIQAPKTCNKELKQQAIEVLNFLNQKTNRYYRPVDANLNFIISRLKSGVTVDNCRGVIAKKCRDWGQDANMSQYLRPATLFNKTNFEQYLGELPYDKDLS